MSVGEYDCIVAGAGSAGCAAAARLAGQGLSVLLLEAGGTNRGLYVRMPAGGMYLTRNKEYDWGFLTEPDPSRRDRIDYWPRGKGLGGTSTINGMLFLRGQRQDYDHWAQMGATGWTYDDVLPFFRRIERHDLGESELHGGSGPMSVRKQPRTILPVTNTFIEAAQQAGIPLNPDLNGASAEGVSLAPTNQRFGRRHTSAFAYLDSAPKRFLHVMTNVAVRRVLFEEGRAVGVEFTRDDGTVDSARARKEVVLSGGTVGSPQILMLSGVGPGEHLQEHGIPVVADVSGVGKNLQDHVAAFNMYTVRCKTLNDYGGRFWKTVLGAQWMFLGSGHATTPGAQAVVFAKTQPESETADVQLHLLTAGVDMGLGGKGLKRQSMVTIIANVCRPRARGEITLRSATPGDAPVIRHRLLDDPYDIKVLTDACRLGWKIMGEPPMAEQVIERTLPNPSIESDADMEKHLRKTSMPIYHPVGTCRMGGGPDAVVDPRLRVNGVSGLRVADASVMPALISANTHAASVMIGERVADFVGRDAA